MLVHDGVSERQEKDTGSGMIGNIERGCFKRRCGGI